MKKQIILLSAILLTLTYMKVRRAYPEQVVSFEDGIAESIAAIKLKVSEHTKFHYQEKVKRSMFTLQYGKMSGSGVAVEYKGKKFILTNAHVCLAQHQDVVEMNIKKRDAVLSVSLDNDVNFVGKMSYKLSEVFYEPSNDLCLIPYKDILRSVEFLNIDEGLSLRNLIIEDADEITMVTNNHVDEVSLKKGVILNRSAYVHFCSVKKGRTSGNFFEKLNRILKKRRTCYRRKEHYNITTTSIKIIPGDSGAPVFNSKYELIGLSFATQYADAKKYKSAKALKSERVVLEKTIRHGYVTNSENFKVFLDRGIRFLDKASLDL